MVFRNLFQAVIQVFLVNHGPGGGGDGGRSTPAGAARDQGGNVFFQQVGQRRRGQVEVFQAVSGAVHQRDAQIQDLAGRLQSRLFQRQLQNGVSSASR